MNNTPDKVTREEVIRAMAKREGITEEELLRQEDAEKRIRREHMAVILFGWDWNEEYAE